MLSSSNRPFPLNLIVRLLGFLGSAAVATVVIATSAAVLGWATWLESKWGTPAVQFGVYQSTWFALLMGLLGLNVLSAAVVRFPWRKKQTGFLLVHAGILMLLIGCWLTRGGGVDGQMSLLEGDGSSTVLEPGMHFELAIVPGRAADDGSGHGGEAKLINIPFRPGPFNWQDYRRLGWFPWALVGRDQDVIFDRDGVKLEVLDYYSDSRRVYLPELKLRVAHGRSPDRHNIDTWKPVTLAVRSFDDNHTGTHGATAVGAWRELAHGEIVLFRLAETKAETEAFLDSRPVGPLGRWGQIVLHAGGEKFHFLVEDLLDGRPAVLGTSGMAVKLLEFDRKRLQVALTILRAEDDKEAEKEKPSAESGSKPKAMKRSGTLVLHAFDANFDRQDRKSGVYGSYWFDPKNADVDQDDENIARSSPMWAAAERPKLDIMQGHDEKLYYRTWHTPRVGKIATLPTGGPETTIFDADAFNSPTASDEKADANPDRLIPSSICVEQFTPSARPGVEIRPLAYKKEGPKFPRVKVRLSIDGGSREFWLANAAATKADDERRRLVKGDAKHSDDSQKQTTARGAAVQLVGDAQELGFRIVLDDFQRRLDPGTSRPSGYSSRIDFVEKIDADKKNARILKEDVVVSLNRPADFTDPSDGRTYRFFQSSFSGPYETGDRMFDRAEDAHKSDEIYRSTFSVSSDPGRQLKYAGCLMIVAGIVVMYYMKAYFFRKRN